MQPLPLNRTHHFDNMNEAHATVLLKIIFINKAVLRQFYVNLCNTMYEISYVILIFSFY